MRQIQFGTDTGGVPIPGQGITRRRATLGAICLALLSAMARPAQAEPPSLLFPLDCELGKTCFLQQFVDRDPGPGWTDHRCGARSYDGHKGTDIMLRSRETMRAGVTVRAAAPGTVVGVRDGMPDIPRDAPDAPPLDGRDCGNGVAIRDAAGWVMQYCHMREGSIAVSNGQQVQAGAPLGLVGLSGNAVVPHLHLSLRDPDDQVIDPFDARPMGAGCGQAEGQSLWADPLLFAHRPGGAVSAGMTPSVPSYGEVKDRAPHIEGLESETPAIVFWALFYGLEEGDTVLLRLTGPGGALIARQVLPVERDRALEFRATGRKGQGAWPAGVYRGFASLIRDGVVIDEIGAETIVE